MNNKISTGFPSLDAALGGGLSPSSVVLVTSSPGGGRTTFTMTMLGNMAKAGERALFFPYDETIPTTRERMARLGATHPELRLAPPGELHALQDVASGRRATAIAIDDYHRVKLATDADEGGVLTEPAGIEEIKRFMFAYNGDPRVLILTAPTIKSAKGRRDAEASVTGADVHLHIKRGEIVTRREYTVTVAKHPTAPVSSVRFIFDQNGWRES